MDLHAEPQPSTPLLAVQHAARELRVGGMVRFTGDAGPVDVVAAETFSGSDGAGRTETLRGSVLALTGERMRSLGVPADPDQVHLLPLVARDLAAGRIDALRLEAAELTQTNRELTEAGAGLDPATQAELRRLEATSGARAVTGSGVTARVDDGEGGGQAQVVAADLRQLVNQFWRSGAEAIAINGHRLSSRTAIRGAGDAITVDYRSLNRPYRVEAIGNPRTLPARWGESSGGAWWNELAQNRRMRYEVSSVDEITLDADPGMTLRYARVKQ